MLWFCFTRPARKKRICRPSRPYKALGFKPTATAIILNESLVDAGDTRENAFARIYRHSVFPKGH